MRKIINCSVLIFLSFFLTTINAQSVTIKEEIVSIPTYGFGKGNPVPILAGNPKIYPYYKFEEYQHESIKKDWKVVTLENDYIKVMVLPEIGGKVWGAIEKSTGEEFLYKNEVIKFRNIAMRGPWTSGGIEFNFGIIGHHPATATPVDYLTRTNKDGSVSCIVGNTDLPSNTKWTVEIRLEKDKAYFETNASWYNASPLTESYYNWMTAAAVATNDLEFFIPGNTYLEHNGDAHAWPIDEQGKNLAMYKENNFGPSKSYHVVGEYNDFFGGYYHNREFGFGQWSPYEEMPGQKLWLWALSRAGGIWEDLLTDTDGQYIEFQAGRLFDQYSPGATNPIGQVGFDPYGMDQWHEIWFPYKEIGGMKDASEHGVINVETTNGETTIGVNALQKLDNKLRVIINGETVLAENLSLKPIEVLSKTIPSKVSDKIEVYIDGTELSYSSNSEANHIKRPFYPDENLKISQSEQLFFEGCEALEYREYELSRKKLLELIQVDPSHQAGLIKMAELEYRRTNYDKALEYANAVLRMDTYHPEANYIAGIAYRAKKDIINALESLGWAARDIKYRSVAYAQMSEVYMVDKNYKRAKTYAIKALDFNKYNINAREVLLVLNRLIQNKDGFDKEMTAILEMNPINHLAGIEAEHMKNHKDSGYSKALKNIQNEFKEETILSTAIKYHSLGMDEEALSILRKGYRSSKNDLWIAYLCKDSQSVESEKLLNKVSLVPVNFVFPYRRETIDVLNWAVSQNKNWNFKFYLAQNYIAVGLKSKGIAILEELGDKPNSDVFYRFRAKYVVDESFENKSKDNKRALQLNSEDWKVWEENIQFYLQNNKHEEAYDLSKRAYKKFPGNYNIGLAHAKALLNVDKYMACIDVLSKSSILPFELATESRLIFDNAHVFLALEYLKKGKYTKATQIVEKSKEWPENIGVGKPYNVDERLKDYLLAISSEKLKDNTKRTDLLKGIGEYTNKNIEHSNINHVFGLLALKKLAKDIDLEQLLLSLKKTNGFENTKNALAIAMFKGDKVEVQKLLEKRLINEDRFKFIQEVLKLEGLD